MNQIREVAMAYYARATEEEKQLAKQFFGSLDANGDGRVSLAEYKSLLSPWISDDQVFKELDANSDGTLDFEEVLALYYMQKVRIRRCDACKDLLLGAYFSCLLCEKDSPNTCDLCCNCYGGGKFQHHHSTDNFVDNRSMRLLLADLLKHADITQLREGGAKVAFEANVNVDVDVDIASDIVTSAVSAGCRIM